MLASRQKLEQIGCGNGCCAVIAQRVEVEWIEPKKALIQHHANQLFYVVHHRERRHRPWLNAERRNQQFFRAERETWCTELSGERIEVDSKFIPRHHEPQAVLPVL